MFWTTVVNNCAVPIKFLLPSIIDCNIKSIPILLRQILTNQNNKSLVQSRSFCAKHFDKHVNQIHNVTSKIPHNNEISLVPNRSGSSQPHSSTGNIIHLTLEQILCEDSKRKFCFKLRINDTSNGITSKNISTTSENASKASVTKLETVTMKPNTVISKNIGKAPESSSKDSATKSGTLPKSLNPIVSKNIGTTPDNGSKSSATKSETFPNKSKPIISKNIETMSENATTQTATLWDSRNCPLCKGICKLVHKEDESSEKPKKVNELKKGKGLTADSNRKTISSSDYCHVCEGPCQLRKSKKRMRVHRANKSKREN